MDDAPAPIFGLTESRPWYKRAASKWLVLAALALVILGGPRILQLRLRAG